MQERSPLQTFMFSSQGTLLEANRAGLKALQQAGDARWPQPALACTAHQPFIAMGALFCLLAMALPSPA